MTGALTPCDVQTFCGVCGGPGGVPQLHRTIVYFCISYQSGLGLFCAQEILCSDQFFLPPSHQSRGICLRRCRLGKEIETKRCGTMHQHRWIHDVETEWVNRGLGLAGLLGKVLVTKNEQRVGCAEFGSLRLGPSG